MRQGDSVNTFVTFNSIYLNHFKPNSQVKVKVTLVQALRLCTGRTDHGVSRGMALLFLDHGTRRGEGSASRLGRSLPPGKTRYPLFRRLGGPQGRSGQVRKISPPPSPSEFDLRTVQPVVSRYNDWATRPTTSQVVLPSKYQSSSYSHFSSIFAVSRPSPSVQYLTFISKFSEENIKI